MNMNCENTRRLEKREVHIKLIRNGNYISCASLNLRINDENFYHFLKRKLRTSKLYETCVGILIIPVEVASLQFINADILPENNCGKVAGGIFDILVIVIAMLVILIDQKKRIYFLEDFCKIVFPGIANPENTKMKYRGDDLKKE